MYIYSVSTLTRFLNVVNFTAKDRQINISTKPSSFLDYIYGFYNLLAVLLLLINVFFLIKLLRVYKSEDGRFHTDNISQVCVL